MIYLKLIYNFIIVGLFSFGGGYSSIPLAKDAASNFENITDEMLANFIAISESTPGPVSVNLATFIGAEVAGLPGAIVATTANILPAFVIILIFTLFFRKFIDNERVKFTLSLVRPCVVGIIMSVGLYMLFTNVISMTLSNIIDKKFCKDLFIFFVLFIIMFIYKNVTKKSLSTIKLIICGAVIGIAINYFV